MRSSLGMGWLDTTSRVDLPDVLSSWQTHEEAIDQVKNVLTLGLDGSLSLSLSLGDVGIRRALKVVTVSSLWMRAAQVGT
jgi:hypothetical protein